MGIADRARRYVPPVKRKKSPPKVRTKFPPFNIPEDFILQIDTRETRPMFLGSNIDGLSYIIDKVEHGDYTYVGGDDVVGIERKQRSDFYSYIQQYDLTTRKLKAMKHLKFKALVIESSEQDLYDMDTCHTEHMTVQKVREFLYRVNVKYGMHVYMNDDLEIMERWVLDRLIRVYTYERAGVLAMLNYEEMRAQCEKCDGVGVILGSSHQELEDFEENGMMGGENCPWCHGTGERLFTVDEIRDVVEKGIIT